MVIPTNNNDNDKPVRIIRTPGSKTMLTGLNLMVAMATHEESRELLGKFIADSAEEINADPEMIMKCLMEAIEFVNSLNKSLLGTGETPDGEFKQ